MKSKLKLFSQYIVSVLNGNISSSKIREMSIYISVLCAACSLRRNKIIKTSTVRDYNYQEELKLIKNKFPCLYSEYQHVEESLTVDERSRIIESISDIYNNHTDSRNIISWLYQYLKRDLAKRAFGNIGKEQNKIKGDDLLFTTQFFTDEYMVEHLVDKVFEEKSKLIEDMLFIDPASGGGNFLIYIFEKLYKWYKVNTILSDNIIINKIFNHHIVGYDLDSHLAKIASLSIFVNACRYTLPSSDIYIYGGSDGDLLGYLDSTIKTSKIGTLRYEDIISKARKAKRNIAYITNPPFMGKRDMDNNLKSFLISNYPLCKGDLCVSFVYKLLQDIRVGDIVAVVSQNGWLNLSSLKMFRKSLLEHYFLNECVDLGSNAFADINGEKTNVVLCVFEKQTVNTKNHKSRFINLKAKSYIEKQTILHSKMKDVIDIDSSYFLENPSYEICYQLGVNFSSLKTLPNYGSFAKCMQGTSTGNNKEFIKYAWEICNDTDWLSVSKGGGYSKWSGLNYYVVKWGKDACHIKSNKGSAIRNLDRISDTELVYSDTGTLGLNVRLKNEGQVFIASGPGIKVLSGVPICHMAFLSSKVSTFLLKAKNPKFTISAGYINQLPVVESILNSRKIEKLAQEAIKYKLKYLSTKLPNIEFVHYDYQLIDDIDSHIFNNIASDITNDYKRLKAEESIDIEVLKSFKFSKTEKKDIYDIVGGLRMTKYGNNSVQINLIDSAIVSALNDNCQFSGKKINGFVVGSESILEYIAYSLDISVGNLYNMICTDVNLLLRVASLYKIDFLHKIIIKLLNIERVTEYQKKRVSVAELSRLFQAEYPYLYTSMGVSEEIISDILINHHKKCFFNKPIVHIENNIAVIK